MQPLLTSEPNQVGAYRLLARLGKGAMGSVYLARSRSGRIVAVKVIRPDLAEDPEFRERFRRETAAARAVGGFWTAAVVDADPDAPQPWLATEYVPGPTLHKAVAEHGPLPERTVASLAAGLAEAVGAVHRAALVHRDLKPANVLLGPDGPRVIDFGISRAMTASAMTATGMFFGTPGFFSPEQTVGEEVGPPSDIFSLGAVLVFAATGHGPFGDDHTAAMLYRVVHNEPALGEVPDRLRPLLAACLDKEPGNRPTSGQLLDQIGEPLPQDQQWLPDSIVDTITEHRTELQRAATAAEPKPATRTFTAAQPAPTAAAAPAVPETPPAPAPPAEPAHPRRGEIVRAQPRATARRPVPAQPKPRDEPGPVFAAGRRVRALCIAVLGGGLLLALAAAAVYERPGHSLLLPLLLGLCCLGVIPVVAIWQALTPKLHLKINSAGLRVHRLGQAREIPWNRVRRVGIVGRGSKQSVTLWLIPGAYPPKSSWWHGISAYHGGVRFFPIGASGGWWKRRREIKRIRLALHQYAPHAYDPRLL